MCSRPGRMRFEYDPPSQLKIVADGTQVTMWDPANSDFGQWPIGWTAASFLVKEPLKLSGDITVEANQRTPDGLLALTLVQTRKPQEGKVVVRLSENPMQLRGWSDHRQPRQQGRCRPDQPADRHAARRFAVQVRRPRRRTDFAAAATATTIPYESAA